MNRKLIIDGNAVYEIDEECMLRRRLDQESGEEKEDRPESFPIRGRTLKTEKTDGVLYSVRWFFYL